MQQIPLTEVFVKGRDSTTKMVDVKPSDTIKNVLLEAGKKIFPDLKPEEVLQYFCLQDPKRLQLDDDKKLEDYKIQRDTTLYLALRPLPITYDEAVKSNLGKTLLNLTKESGPLVVFIGIGSYDNGHGNDWINQQQCPRPVYLRCADKKWKLKIILIDPGFVKPNAFPQIYTIDSKWMGQKIIEGNKGWWYKYDQTGLDFQLWTYATTVFPEEYDGKVTTLAGVDILKEVVPLLTEHKGCIVMGNFYAKNAQPHIAAGDKELLAALGYKPHP